MRIPEVKFTEVSPSVNIPQLDVYNRIGMISNFDRGPANDPRLISNYRNFADLYGSNAATGSVAFQAAYDQGAREFSLIRVLGRSKAAKAAISFSGVANQNFNSFLNLRYIGAPVDKGELTLDVTINTDPSSIYTSTQSGRYWFEVTGVNTTDNTVTMRWKFIPISNNVINLEDVDWTSSTNLTVDFDTVAPGSYVTIEQGLKLSFGPTGANVDALVEQFRVGNAFSVRTNSYTYTIPISTSFIPSQVANTILSYISGGSPMGEVKVNDLNNGVVIELEPELRGSLGNRWAIYFTGFDGTGLVASASNTIASPAIFMSGGVDGPRSAFRDFYALDGTLVLRLIANSEGGWGNQLRVSIYSIDSNRYSLSITDLNSDQYNPPLVPESYIIDSFDIDQDGFLNQLKDSKFIRGIFMPKFLNPNADLNNVLRAPQRLAPSNPFVTDSNNPAFPSNYGPSYLTNVSFEEGYDGPATDESDYLYALDLMKGQPVHLVCCPGKYGSNSLKAALITHAEQSNELEGLRISILNASPTLTPISAIRESQGFRSDRAVMVAGWSTYSQQPNAARFGLSPDAVYAGKLAAIPVFVGPNARRVAGSINSINEVTTSRYSSRSDLQIITDAKIEVIALDPAVRSYNFVSAVTLSSSTTWEKVYLRRVHDMIRMDLYKALQSYKSEPHTEALRRELSSAIRAYMEEKVRRGEIASVGAVTADSTNNNAATYTNYELNIYLEFLPIFSADYINITMVRNSQNGQVIFAS